MSRRRQRRNPEGGHTWLLEYMGTYRPRGPWAAGTRWHWLVVNRAPQPQWRTAEGSYFGETVQEILEDATEAILSVDPNATFVTEGF